ncbi:fasciclin domain-containing protein [Luteolibacter pohnpeiensis]|uniref:Fasciclin domain-containing protein n=1 Tax=Luteolibacter pohnpeiensis TaxID=454153 RepID=A0A934S686_9BACT|nr:fasciclin domain-containing protein [Luteolibacter pohnpeiensis]MBK1883855.1 fasciclin domain-containing protein [Luteolibacter pohnpeiensis]
MKTTDFTKIAVLCALSVTAPIVQAEPEAKDTKDAKPATEKQEIKPGTLAASIHDGVTYSILFKALKATGLDQTLAGSDNYTVFAPTDEAFEKLPEGTLDKLMLPENKEKLRSLILYHVIPGSLPSMSLKDGDVKTANGEKVEIDVDGNKVEVDDSHVVNSDILASNGVMHVIDKVLVPKSLDGFADLDAD